METYPFNPEDIRVQRQDIGRDTLLVVTGGEAHIGAASTAYLEADEYKVSTTIVSGHQEHVLSEPSALHAARLLGRTVTVVMGIHYDCITREQISEVGSVVARLIDEALDTSKKIF
ncbi:hypothetical protein [Saccharibacillus sacchari]|uniref:prenylated flavin chaperone LpdD n=1 Tax=Saccharibacillus sacchari TaxID=456493 RepID=UPI0004B02401|nr:hypothetical protein [Saccharibacillus sacchari]